MGTARAGVLSRPSRRWLGAVGALSWWDGDGASALDKFVSGMCTGERMSERERSAEREGRREGHKGRLDRSGHAGRLVQMQPLGCSCGPVRRPAPGAAGQERGWQRPRGLGVVFPL